MGGLRRAAAQAADVTLTRRAARPMSYTQARARAGAPWTLPLHLAEERVVVTQAMRLAGAYSFALDHSLIRGVPLHGGGTALPTCRLACTAGQPLARITSGAPVE
jgi:hypothetical protein